MCVYIHIMLGQVYELLILCKFLLSPILRQEVSAMIRLHAYKVKSVCIIMDETYRHNIEPKMSDPRGH